MNNADLVETVPAHIPYGKFIPVPEGCTSYDTMRDFHLNLFADPDRCFVDESEPFLDIKSDGRAQTEPHPVYTGTDPFDIAKIQSFMGPHTDYLVTTLISPEERSVELALGHTAPFKLWVNGTLVGRGKECTWWTCENKHISVKLNKGENTVILKCSVQGGSAEYSIIPRVDDFSWIQYSDIDCALYRGV
jgi:hypothetical protein